MIARKRNERVPIPKISISSYLEFYEVPRLGAFAVAAPA